MSNPSDRLTVLHVTAPAPFGGLERVVEALAAGHCQAGHAVHVAMVVDGSVQEHPLAQALRRSGVAVELLALPARAYRRERAATASGPRSSTHTATAPTWWMGPWRGAWGFPSSPRCTA